MSHFPTVIVISLIFGLVKAYFNFMNILIYYVMVLHRTQKTITMKQTQECKNIFVKAYFNFMNILIYYVMVLHRTQKTITMKQTQECKNIFVL